MIASLLNRPTLVLNRNWQPVGVATVARSITKVYLGVARVVDPEDYQLYDWTDWSTLNPRAGEKFIQSQRLQVRIPEVIALTGYSGLPEKTVAFSRRNVFQRDKYTCQYCGVQPGSDELTVDHVLPRSRGGMSTWENCVLACVECNKRKANRTPDQAGMRLRRKPARPAWKPLYAAQHKRIASWAKFISDSYWTVELEN